MTNGRDERRRRDEQRRAAVLALPVLAVRRHSAIATADVGDVLVCTSIGPDGEAVALWSTAEDSVALTSTTTQPGRATFPDPRTPRPVAARITVHRPGRTVVTQIPDLPLAHPMVQVLPQDRVLVVAARCRWRPDGPDRNAMVYDADGQVVAEQTLGDGIQHVLATRGGQVWVGYFDEGVYGNYGWGDAGVPSPLGAPGLVRFSSHLQPDWRYPSHVDNPWGAISDCYALNVDGDTAWACYYTDFPVVRVRAGTLTGWRNTSARGGRALAVSDTRVALCGGYGPDRDRLVVGTLGDNQLHQFGEYRLVLPDGSPMPAAARVIGRGSDLHLLIDSGWYRLDLDDIPTEPHP